MSKPVVKQPGTNKKGLEWMQTGAGLEFLADLDQLSVQQQQSAVEVIVDWETKNRFAITNNKNQQVLFAGEESTACQRWCCCLYRGFVMHLTNSEGQEVIRTERKFKCCSGCCWCANGGCGMETTVESPPGNIIGYVRQLSSKWNAHFAIQDADRNHLYTVWGMCCPCQGVCCTDDLEYPVSYLSPPHELPPPPHELHHSAP
ncbi:hypothetical protein ScPMuIL_008856 [Solemya velum]